MNYLYIDGDNIGLKIEQSFLNNEEEKLAKINIQVIDAVKSISRYLVDQGNEIIFSGADGIISKSGDVDVQSMLEFVRRVDSELTFSIGVGSDLKNSYLALRYAKSFGKNLAVVLSENGVFRVIS